MAERRRRDAMPLGHEALVEQVLGAWRRHDGIMQYLLAEIPAEGLAARPAASRGRDVARQFEHLARVREGWLTYHTTGDRPRAADHPRDERAPTRAALAKALKTTGRQVEQFLASCLREDAEPRMFGGEVLRWMTYLVSHESHHRGQILLALKQSGVRLDDDVKLEGIWGRWIHKA